MKIKIVADSSANMTALEGMDFASVPLKIVAGDREFVDAPGLDLEEMVRFLRGYKGTSGSSCPSVGEWIDAFGDADVVFGTAITSNLSGSYNASQIAKAEYEEANPGKKVYILDSLSAGPELELIVEKLGELVQAGLEPEVIWQEIQKYARHTHLLFSLESLKNLANNGRTSHAVAALAGILGLRLVGKASDEGTLEPMDKCRGEKKALNCIVEHMENTGYAGGKVRISHCFNAAAANELASLIRKDFPDAQIKVGKCGALCSFYAERGGLLIGFEDQGV